MQTTYYTTPNYIRHEGNVVDLGAYRQRLDAVSGGHWVSEAEPMEELWAPPAAQLYVVERPRSAAPRAKKHRNSSLRFWLDVGVSMAVLLFTMTAVMQFLRFF